MGGEWRSGHRVPRLPHPWVMWSPPGKTTAFYMGTLFGSGNCPFGSGVVTTP